MDFREDRRVSTALRGALTQTWDLNVRAIPTSLVWAVSLMFIFQTPNLLIQMACSLLCSIISLLNATIVKFSHKRIKPLQLIKTQEFQRILLLNALVGSLFVIALNNTLNLNPASLWLSVLIFSPAPTLFVAWMGLMTILNPIFVMRVATNTSHSTAEIFLCYLKTRKRVVLLTGLILVIFAPFIFFFISVVLTLAQALTVITFEGLSYTAKSEVEIF